MKCRDFFKVGVAVGVVGVLVLALQIVVVVIFEEKYCLQVFELFNLVSWFPVYILVIVIGLGFGGVIFFYCLVQVGI